MKGPLKDNVRIEIVKSNFTAMEQVDEKEERTEEAVVLEVGVDVVDVQPGDKILFKAYNIDEIEYGGEKYIVIPEADIKYLL